MSEEERKAFDLKQKAFDFLKTQSKETQKKSFTTSPSEMKDFEKDFYLSLGILFIKLSILDYI